MIANTPKVPYYAVIFTTLRTEVDDDYMITANRMEELAKKNQINDKGKMLLFAFLKATLHMRDPVQ